MLMFWYIMSNKLTGVGNDETASYKWEDGRDNATVMSSGIIV